MQVNTTPIFISSLSKPLLFSHLSKYIGKHVSSVFQVSFLFESMYDSIIMLHSSAIIQFRQPFLIKFLPLNKLFSLHDYEMHEYFLEALALFG